MKTPAIRIEKSPIGKRPELPEKYKNINMCKFNKAHHCFHN